MKVIQSPIHVVLVLAPCLAFLTSGEPSQASDPANQKPIERKLQPPRGDAQEPANYAGVHNLVTYAPGVISGSVPEGDEGFETLRAMGVKTIISVDGAAPAVEKARSHGIRYVHLPIGYNGMDRQRTLEIARAIQVAQERDPAAPVYLHCHHGRHRSAGALGAAAVTLGQVTPGEAQARMKVSGTSPSYTGLYRCVAEARPAKPEELAVMPSDFPSVWKTSGLVKSMVEVDEIYEHLKLIEKAGWGAPKDHPDLVPAAEAGRLADIFRNLLDDERVKSKPVEFREWLTKSSKEVEFLEGLTTDGSDADELGKRFKVITASCKECHVKYRD